MRVVIILAGLLLAACAAHATQDRPHLITPAPCNEEGGETYLNQRVTAELGKEILTSTGATSLRWIAPGEVVTMDVLKGRVSIHYDSDMRVIQVTCG